ncbi:MAG: hypothetical protein IPO03_15875 [Bacteroidetes bacterium]|nr:hypothetical protein [Bacteroidota bacterium]
MHNNTHAQAIYTDIDPDVVLQLHGDVEYIDMDDDGSNDFFIFKKSSYFTNSEYSWYRFNRIFKVGLISTPKMKLRVILQLMALVVGQLISHMHYWKGI